MDITAHFSVDFAHRLWFGHDVLGPRNPTLAQALGDPAAQPEAGSPARVLAFVDRGVLSRWPDLPQKLQDYATAHRDAIALTDDIHAVPGGEVCKNDRAVLDQVCRAIHDAGLCRRSYVLAIGGGAVLDVVGFAASIAHRGVRLVRLPTTTLAQADAGVGVKNGVNAFGKKNYLGTFCPPWAVVHDDRFLKTLSERDWRSGFSEAVKVALVKDAALFSQIAEAAAGIVGRDMDIALPVIRRSAELHLQHIARGGDPFELGAGRPLDFGHWAAHRLESLSGYELLHGEAVAIGIALDTVYSTATGLLSWPDANRITRCLADLGFQLDHPAMRDTPALLQGLEEFREHLGGELSITLLRGVGKPVQASQIDHAAMQAAIEHLSAQTVNR